MQGRRPLGVSILAVLAIISGVLGIMGSLGMLGFGALSLESVGWLAVGFGVFTLALALLNLAFGIGAWQLRPWAWTLGVALQGLTVVQVLISWLTQGLSGQGLFTLLITGVVLFYLFDPGVRRAFGRSDQAPRSSRAR